MKVVKICHVRNALIKQSYSRSLYISSCETNYAMDKLTQKQVAGWGWSAGELKL